MDWAKLYSLAAEIEHDLIKSSRQGSNAKDVQELRKRALANIARLSQLAFPKKKSE